MYYLSIITNFFLFNKISHCLSVSLTHVCPNRFRAKIGMRQIRSTVRTAKSMQATLENVSMCSPLKVSVTKCTLTVTHRRNFSSSTALTFT